MLQSEAAALWGSRGRRARDLRTCRGTRAAEPSPRPGGQGRRCSDPSPSGRRRESSMRPTQSQPEEGMEATPGPAERGGARGRAGGEESQQEHRPHAAGAEARPTADAPAPAAG